MTAFEALYAAQFTSVRNMLTANIHDRHTAEDLAQAAFLSAWQHWGEFTDLGDGGTAWVMRIAQRKMIDWLRRKARTEKSLDQVLTGLASRSPDAETAITILHALPAEDVEDENAICARLDAIAELPAVLRELQRCPELLARVRGEKYAVIAARAGIKESAARTRVNRQRKRLAATGWQQLGRAV